MNDIINFWGLIAKYRIEIPIIQRDYAQGRATTKINEIRKKIIYDMYCSLENNKTLELDFVYGSVDGAEFDVFKPLDGQQRLTTLFLLHWYLAWQARDFTRMELLKRFTYETRTSSRRFCQALVEHAEALPCIANNEGLIDLLENESWFFLSWRKDPTIKAMLQTLSDIHAQFTGKKNLWDGLCNVESCPIMFRFVKLEEFGLEDDLYIKMNARGKLLTEFENFKAKFEQLVSEKFEDELYYFSHKIDGKWTDMFWTPPENARFDDKYLNFFRTVAVNNFALKMDTSTSKNQDQIANMNTNISLILEQIDAGALRDIMVLDNLSEMRDCELTFKKVDIMNLFRDVTNLRQPTYFQRIMFYALSRFLSENTTNPDNTRLSEWLRVIYNFAKNTEYDEVVEFARSIKSIDELVRHSKNILHYISHSGNSIQGFNANQIEEERVKACLMLKSKDWEKAILLAEAHKYFDGQISFILLFSGLISEYNSKRILDWTDADEKSFLHKYLEYFRKARSIFSDDGLQIKGYLWERALLCKGYYWIGKGDRVSLLQNVHRDYSWKRLLRETDNHNEKRGYVKDVLDCISPETVYDDLQKIIDDSTIKDLRKYFIEEPRIISACNGRFIQKHEDTYLLLKTSITAGYHKELRSYALYLKLISNYCREDNVTYSDQCGINNPKMITSINGINVKVGYQNNEFYVYFDSDYRSFPDEDGVIDFLKKNSVI